MLHRVLAVLVVTALMVAVLAFPALAAHNPRAGVGLATAECAVTTPGPTAAACPKPGPPAGPPGPP